MFGTSKLDPGLGSIPNLIVHRVTLQILPCYCEPWAASRISTGTVLAWVKLKSVSGARTTKSQSASKVDRRVRATIFFRLDFIFHPHSRQTIGYVSSRRRQRRVSGPRTPWHVPLGRCPPTKGRSGSNPTTICQQSARIRAEEKVLRRKIGNAEYYF